MNLFIFLNYKNRNRNQSPRKKVSKTETEKIKILKIPRKSRYILRKITFRHAWSK